MAASKVVNGRGEVVLSDEGEDERNHRDVDPADALADIGRALERLPYGDSGIEGAPEAAGPDLTDGAISERLEGLRTDLLRIVSEYLGDDPRLKTVAEQIADRGDRALRVWRDRDLDGVRRDASVLADLEAIVRTDGSRPSFLIRNGKVDLRSSPAGNWADSVNVSADLIEGAAACVGRIDVPGSDQGFAGTGFLIGANLILTNRHVLQACAARDAASREWSFKPGTSIDFGHEFRGVDSVGRRKLLKVAFVGKDAIKTNGSVDHAKLDLALIEIEPAGAGQLQKVVLAIEASRDWQTNGKALYTIGYPGDPGWGMFEPTLLEQLFQLTYGCKRIAPGLTMASRVSVQPWTVAHDATTLAGNSGSLIALVGREHVAVALHYGGRRGEPRENWGHVLGLVLDITDGVTDIPLGEHLHRQGVMLIDRSVG